MALTSCLSCNETYIDTEESCPSCNKTLERQLFENEYTPISYKFKLLWKWFCEVIFY